MDLGTINEEEDCNMDVEVDLKNAPYSSEVTLLSNQPKFSYGFSIVSVESVALGCIGLSLPVAPLMG